MSRAFRVYVVEYHANTHAKEVYGKRSINRALAATASR
jgi:hypothetical protein